MYLSLNIVMFQLAVSLLKVDLSISSIYSWVFSRSHSKIRTSSQELKSDSNPFQIFSHVFGVYLDPNLEKLSLFSKNKIFQKVVLPGVFFVCQETSFRRPMSPASDNSLMEGAMATGLGPKKMSRLTVAYPSSSRNRGSRGIFVGWFTISNMATWPGWLEDNFFFWWEQEL